MTEVTYDGKLVRSIHFNTTGEDGKDLWIRFITADGVSHDTYILKGSI